MLLRVGLMPSVLRRRRGMPIVLLRMVLSIDVGRNRRLRRVVICVLIVSAWVVRELAIVASSHRRVVHTVRLGGGASLRDLGRGC